MRFSTFPPTKLAAALCAAASLALPSIAGAQQYPSYSTAAQQTVKGTITGFNGAYTVYVQDQKGYGDNVVMHDGTVINPTGIKLQEGMPVTIYGYANGKQFDAWRIDVTPPQNMGYNGANGAYGYGGGYGGGYGYGSPYGAYPYYGSPYGGYGWGGSPWWGVGIGWWGGWGWPGWGWPGYGGYPYFPGNVTIYNSPGFFRGPGRSGTVSAPVRGTVGAPVMRGGGGGTVQGRPPRP